MQKKLAAYLSGNYPHINDYCHSLLSAAKKNGRIIKGAFNGVLITASPLNNLQDLLDEYWNAITRRNNSPTLISDRPSDGAATPAISKYPPD
ncbi:MAG: hypothetical protein LBJ25_05185 [Candidatus Margulisbacteria bacterium]|jgi:hypothetical protein|nr:hypothetical protein [Candidatus Margulisiibacteriota bacterium]